MVNPIPPQIPLQTPSSLFPSNIDAIESGGGTIDFQNLLLQSIEQVSSLDQNAQSAIEQNLAGGEITEVEVFSAVKKADLSLRMLMQIRNKLMDAYEEIKQMRM